MCEIYILWDVGGRHNRKSVHTQLVKPTWLVVQTYRAFHQASVACMSNVLHNPDFKVGSCYKNPKTAWNPRSLDLLIGFDLCFIATDIFCGMPEYLINGLE